MDIPTDRRIEIAFPALDITPYITMKMNRICDQWDVVQFKHWTCGQEEIERNTKLDVIKWWKRNRVHL